MATDIRHEANEAAQRAWTRLREYHTATGRWHPILEREYLNCEQMVRDIEAIDYITQVECVQVTFGTPTVFTMSEAQLDALHEATHADLDDLAAAEDIPLAYSPYRYPAAFADWTELELRSAHGDR